jgi:hypothetical protein
VNNFYENPTCKPENICGGKLGATPLFDYGSSFQSGVALRFPPQSKKIWLPSLRCALASLRLCVKSGRHSINENQHGSILCRLDHILKLPVSRDWLFQLG